MQRLRDVWEELHPTPKAPTLAEQQEKIYEEVMCCMRAAKRRCEYETRKLVKKDVPYLMEWLRDTHDLECKLEEVDRGCNPSTHDTWFEECIVITW